MINKVNKMMGKIVNCMALILVIQSANSACGWIFHQPEFPEQANKFKKVN